MPRMILPADDLRRLIRERRRTGADRLDEVWDGVYVMSPLADNEHQELVTSLAGVAFQVVDVRAGARVFAGTNVSDREDDWRKNYRCPDIAVFLPGNPAQDRGSHWFGGPDFAIEIISPNDHSRKKFAFYAGVGVRELLLVARRPWRLELYRRDGDRWDLIGTSDPKSSATLASDVLPLSFRLLPDDPRPRIEINQTGGDGHWTI